MRGLRMNRSALYGQTSGLGYHHYQHVAAYCPLSSTPNTISRITPRFRLCRGSSEDLRCVCRPRALGDDETFRNPATRVATPEKDCKDPSLTNARTPSLLESIVKYELKASAWSHAALEACSAEERSLYRGAPGIETASDNQP